MTILLKMAPLLVLLLLPAHRAKADDPNAPVDTQGAAAPIKLACVGDSITFGYGSKISYPKQLQALLGSGWEVDNFGVSGTTLITEGYRPYQKEAQFQAALASLPQVVVVMLGTNDTKPANAKWMNRFGPDYQNLIGKFKALASHPRIFICLPVPVDGEGVKGINEAALETELPVIGGVAQQEDVGLIDLHTALQGHAADFPDHVHPNDEAAGLVAKAVAKALTGKDTP